MVKFVAHHEPRIAAPFKSHWNETLRINGKKTSFTPKRQNRAPFFMFIDEAEFTRDDTKLLALAISVSQHERQIVDETREVLWGEMQDLWASGDIDTLTRKGLHFADATQDLRLSYVKRLTAMPFEGYVAFHPYNDPRDYENTYLRLLGAMITRRLMAAESQFVQLCFEENNKVSQSAVRDLVQSAHEELKRTNNRHPKLCLVEFVSKPKSWHQRTGFSAWRTC